MIAMSKPADAMHLLEKHFDTAFAAPDGIKKLRELILTLAMQGKLVPQDPNDQPAGELLKEIEAEKKRLVKEGKIKAQNPLPEIQPEEVPYELPKGWEWVRLCDISEYIQRGKGPSYSDIEEIPVISQKCIQWSGFDKNVVRFIEPATLDNYQVERFIRNGDLLWNSTGTGTLGRINIYRDELNAFKRVVADSHVTVVRLNGVCNDYVLKFLMSPSVQNCIEENASGTTNQIELNTSTVINQIIPLPPLAEQRRIVAKIDQLMVRCDELEKLRAEHDKKRIAAHTAALNRLLIATEGEAFSETWNFITQNFGELYSAKENVAELRKAILQLAVMGKLVPQNSNDQPASELLKEIAAEKKRRVEAGKIKSLEPQPKIKEVPYLLPANWYWCYLDDICTLITDGTHCTPKYTESGIPFLSVKNISSGKIDLSDVKSISEEEHNELTKRCKPENGDILFTKIGTTGIAVSIDTDTEFSIFVSVALLKLVQKSVDTDFITRLLNSPLVKKYSAEGTEGVGNKNLVLRKIKAFLIPLPPLAEQRRIVAKIDQLMSLCDELEKQIDAATGKQTSLLNAVIAQV
jgi:type I restriction enzyme, S subunit